jgi:hypothetical protein
MVLHQQHTKVNCNRLKDGASKATSIYHAKLYSNDVISPSFRRPPLSTLLHMYNVPTMTALKSTMQDQWLLQSAPHALVHRSNSLATRTISNFKPAAPLQLLHKASLQSPCIYSRSILAWYDLQIGTERPIKIKRGRTRNPSPPYRKILSLSSRAPDKLRSIQTHAAQNKLPSSQTKHIRSRSQVPKHSAKSFQHAVMTLPHLKTLSPANRAPNQITARSRRTHKPNFQVLKQNAYAAQVKFSSTAQNQSGTPHNNIWIRNQMPVSASILSNDFHRANPRFQRKPRHLSHHHTSHCRPKGSNQRSGRSHAKAYSMPSEISHPRQSSLSN